MKYLCCQLLGCLLGFGWLAGCHEAPRPPAAPASLPPASAPPPWWSPPVPTLAQQGHHRSEGTLAGRPVFQETIAWAALRPLLRARSPLWRRLRVRGL